jgi:hypothetical protein
MIETRIFLRCEGDGCDHTYPQVKGTPAVVDGAIHTPAELRFDAARFHSWLRISGHDYCDRCAFLYSRVKKGGKRGR